MTRIEKATFGMGCFWEPDIFFSKIPGVLKTTVGFSGGMIPNPTYKNVCGGETGHTEVVQIEFDPEKISFKELLYYFWREHDASDPQKTQYKSVVFYENEEQKQLVEEGKKDEEARRGGKEVLTEVLPLQAFYPAEEYHQKYLEKVKRYVSPENSARE